MKESVTLRPAGMSDARLLLDWRNDPGTRAQSLNTDPVERGEHYAWLSRAIGDEDCRLAIAEVGGEPVGTVRGERIDGTWRLSWSVAPDARGRGIGSEMVARFVDSLEGPIRAEVKVGNAASCRIAERVGMALQETIDGVHHFADTRSPVRHTDLPSADGVMRIGKRTIGSSAPPFIIAEMSGNHNQSLERALAIVDGAAEAGAHALKVQTYTADTMTLPVSTGEFFIDDQDSLWHGQSLHDLYEVASTPWDWHAAIFERARERGIIAFSTPFDETAVDFLEDLNVPCYKIASFENTHLPLIRKVAETGKPMIISTGMATVAELDETVRAARGRGCEDLILLKCTSTYPATPANTNLNTIPHLRELFGCEVGLSDHTLGIGVSIASVSLGATVIEKHFTLDRAAGGVDSAFSMEPSEMRSLVEETKRAWQALGDIRYGPLPAEEPSMRFRRSLYIAEDIVAGDELTRENLRVVRPGYGLAPKHLESLLGLRVNQDLAMGTAMRWEYLG